MEAIAEETLQGQVEELEKNQQSKEESKQMQGKKLAQEIEELVEVQNMEEPES